MTDLPPACLCASLPDLAAVPMGGDGWDERVFATIDVVQDHGSDLWWLYLARCHGCAQHWMIAQEERIFDIYFLRRVNDAVSEGIKRGEWPEDFLTYERVLETGHGFARPCVFLDPLAGSLQSSVEDLRAARPTITIAEIARLLGVTPRHALRLLKQQGPLAAAWARWWAAVR